MASLKKIRKTTQEKKLGHEEVKGIVKQALESDVLGKDELLGRLKGQGIDKDIASCYFELIQEDASLKLNLDDFDQLREFFALLGVESSVESFKQILAFFQKDEPVVQRNSVLLLEFFISTVNIFSHAKLREAVRTELPELTTKLWNDKNYGLATYVARQLVYVLLLEQTYLETKAADVWTGILTREMKKNPVVALLSILLTGEETKWTKSALGAVEFDAETVNEDPVTSIFAQFSDIVLQHSESLLFCLPADLASRCLAQVFKYSALRTEEPRKSVENVVGQLTCNSEIMARDELAREIVTAAAAISLEENLDTDKKTTKLLSRLQKGRLEEEDAVGPSFEEKLTTMGLSAAKTDLDSLSKWPTLLEIQENGPAGFLEEFCDKIKPVKVAKLLKKTSKMLETSSPLSAVLAVTQQLIRKLPSTETALLAEILVLLAGQEDLPPAILDLCAEAVKKIARSKEERTVVTLSLTIATIFNETKFEAEAMFGMEALLYNCLRYTHPTICNDQIAVYAGLVTKHLRGCQFFVQWKKGSEREVERLVHGAAKIAYQISQHQKFFSRVLCSIISETIINYQHIEQAMCILHSISDKNSSSLLATAMPPAEKRQLARAFQELQKYKKRVV